MIILLLLIYTSFSFFFRETTIFVTVCLNPLSPPFIPNQFSALSALVTCYIFIRLIPNEKDITEKC